MKLNITIIISISLYYKQVFIHLPEGNIQKMFFCQVSVITGDLLC